MTNQPDTLEHGEPSLDELYEMMDDVGDYAMEHYIELHRHQPEDTE